ncbi:hypothetical protein R1flu_006999 [Riccia fluitans]|uniref:Uncharacterized protein n=1 Tax=Riccia fluitans TaxID=41844 RepID=A0ABD1YXW6_9MARC
MEGEEGVTEAEGGVTEAEAGNMEAEEGVTEVDGGVMEANLEEATEIEGGVMEPHLEEVADREGGVTEAKEGAREMECVVPFGKWWEGDHVKFLLFKKVKPPSLSLNFDSSRCDIRSMTNVLTEQKMWFPGVNLT